MAQPLISVIIPTYNEQRFISGCLESLFKQTYRNIEIIVVDDGSTDRTYNILKSIKGIKLLKQQHQGPGAARNKGAQKSKGSILVFVDADMKFSPKFIALLTKPIRSDQVIGTFSTSESVANNNNFWARSWSQIRGFRTGKMHPTSVESTQPVFRAILKSEFQKAGGFDPHRGYDDDWTLSEKLGKKASNAPDALFYHYNPDTLNDFYYQAKWLAKRKYKLGLLGKIIALFRYSLPLSLLRSLIISFKFKSITLIFAQLVFDAGQVFGVIESIKPGSKAK